MGLNVVERDFVKVYVPDYYKDFKCIAHRCKHSCCIGWEIDIDADTHAYYKSVPGDFGLRLKYAIVEDEEGAHFALDAEERCPFLNGSGLCDLITTLGEDKLCRICSDHPRYRNYYDDCMEMGLGLCCEAVAELILTKTEPTQMVLLEGDGAVGTEDGILAFRKRVLSVLQDRSQGMQARIEALCAAFGLSLPDKTFAQWCAFYMGLEQLDSAWSERLTQAKENTYMPSDCKQEQLVCYFVFRHLADGADDGRILERLAFALHATAFICAMSTDDADFMEVARMYSAEIEYSEENTEALLSIM